MKERIKSFKGIVVVDSPVHIGNGRAIEKNEYVYDPINKQVHVIDIPKLYTDLVPALQNRFEDFYIENRQDLKTWLKFNRGWQDKEQYKKYISYSMATGTPIEVKERGGFKLCEIKSFVKDPFIKPYVPGSSVKGLLRSALLSYVLHEQVNDFTSEIGKLLDEVFTEEKVNPKKFLRKEIIALENSIFNSWLRKKRSSFIGKELPAEDAVNCCLSGLIVGDSAPLTCDKLIVCQKIDQTPKGENKSLPIFRECLMSGTMVEFKLAIDNELCPFSIDDIKKGITCYCNDQRDGFYKKFIDYAAKDHEDCCYLGGGVGFVSKTVNQVICDIDGGNSSLEANDNIFYRTLNRKIYEIHHHNLDQVKFKVSPHMRKLTLYKNQYYDMGKVHFIFEEEVI